MISDLAEMSEWTPGVGDGQGGLACCSSWSCKKSDVTERLNWTELNWTSVFCIFVEIIWKLYLIYLKLMEINCKSSGYLFYILGIHSTLILLSPILFRPIVFNLECISESPWRKYLQIIFLMGVNIPKYRKNS